MMNIAKSIIGKNMKRNGFAIGIMDYSHTFLVIILAEAWRRIQYVPSPKLIEPSSDYCDYLLDNSQFNTTTFYAVNIFVWFCSLLLTIGLMTQRLTVIVTYIIFKPVSVLFVTFLTSSPILRYIVNKSNCNTEDSFMVEYIALFLILIYVCSALMFWYGVNAMVQDWDEIILFDRCNSRENDQLNSLISGTKLPPMFREESETEEKKPVYLNIDEYLKYLNGIEVE